MGEIVFKGAEVRSAGTTLRNAGYDAITSVSVDLSGCGSAPVASAASDFGMWLSTMLMLHADDVVSRGSDAVDAVSLFEGTDASLKGALDA